MQREFNSRKLINGLEEENLKQKYTYSHSIMQNKNKLELGNYMHAPCFLKWNNKAWRHHKVSKVHTFCIGEDSILVQFRSAE
jgi:hypothetical protein